MEQSRGDVKDLILLNLLLLKKEAVPFKRKFYESSISAVKDMSVEEILSRDTFVDVKGIGQKISSKIIEVRDNGRNLEEVDDIIRRDDGFDICDVYGIGPAAKKKIIDKYGPLRDISHLRRLDEKHDFLTAAQKLGVRYFTDIEKRIPRPEMIAHDDFIAEHTDALFPTISYNITGSYRRGAESSGDIDVLIHADDDRDIERTFKEYVNTLKNVGYITADLAFGDKKFMGMCRLPGSDTSRRIDLLITDKREYYFALLYFTGNDEFNKEMRAYAIDEGYSLNEKGLTEASTKTRVVSEFNSEKSIFDYLGLKFVPPQNRKIGAVERI